jgi:hypothetical protein
MSRTSWKPRHVLGSAALACTLILTSAVPALGAVSYSPVVSTTATHSTATETRAPAADDADPQPALTAATPKINGTAKVGQKLTAIVGKWTADATLKYQWYRNGSGIKGATAKSYTATASDRGKTLTVRVTGSKTGYATKVVTSAKTGVVAAGTLTSAVPKISGTAKAGSRLSVSRGNWTSGTKLTQRWYRNGIAVSGATATSYTLKSADSGTTISVKVTGSRSGYTTVTKASAGVRVLATAKPKPTSNRAAPRGKSCPASHPIKGNADSGIYHVPTGAYYGRTVPEACFKSESAAKAAGYRKSKL